MNEVILKWLASGTIGLVVCSSLWLAGSVQHEVNGSISSPILGQAKPAKTHQGSRVVSRPIDTAASALLVKTSVTLN